MSTKQRITLVAVLICFTLLGLQHKLLDYMQQGLKSIPKRVDSSKETNAVANESISTVNHLLPNLTTPKPKRVDEEEVLETEGFCKCKQYGWPKAYVAKMILNETNPWYNITEEESMSRHHPNLPVKTFKEAINGRRCGLMPSMFSIDWVNTYWQKSKTAEDTTFLLYSAFYDNRPRTNVGPCIRILTLVSKIDPKAPFCYLWFNATGPPVFSRVTLVNYMDWQSKTESRQLPYLLTCRVPSSVAHLVPDSVSVVKRPCDFATNMLKVVGAKERSNTTAFLNGKGPTGDKGLDGYAAVTCGPPLYYFHEDMSVRMIEWVEIMKAMGISRAYLYNTDVHPNLHKVLLYYEQQGFIDLTQFSYPPPYLDEESQRRWWVGVERSKSFALECLHFTDCVLRAMHKYRFLAHYDPDEIPFLRKFENYSTFVDHLLNTNGKGEPPAYYKLQWNFHHIDLGPGPSIKNLPPYLWALRHNQRPNYHLRPTPGKYKSLYDLDTVTGVFSHHALICGSGRCGRERVVNPEEAYLAHYRQQCGDKCKEPASVIEETVLLKYADQVKKNVLEVMNKLGLK